MNEKRGDRMNNDGEKDNNNEYKYDSSDWNIINKMDEESIETLDPVPSSQMITTWEVQILWNIKEPLLT